MCSHNILFGLRASFELEFDSHLVRHGSYLGNVHFALWSTTTALYDFVTNIYREPCDRTNMHIGAHWQVGASLPSKLWSFLDSVGVLWKIAEIQDMVFMLFLKVLYTGNGTISVIYFARCYIGFYVLVETRFRV